MLRKLLIIGLAMLLTLVIQKILRNIGILNNNSLPLEFLSYVVIFFIVYALLDIKNLYTLISQRVV
ncbi:hypothetical protein ABH968_002508 [Lysinibacillus sp. RC79]